MGKEEDKVRNKLRIYGYFAFSLTREKDGACWLRFLDMPEDAFLRFFAHMHPKCIGIDEYAKNEIVVYEVPNDKLTVHVWVRPNKR